jgi:phytoene dehydrogenase-like protein
MNCEVVVVGGGIGGLTTAALLAARGVNVCLFERQSSVGGCVANFKHLGYTFEPTAGLYSGWEPGGIYERVFAQLPVCPPEVQRLSPAYSVRLPDGTELAVSDDLVRFEEDLRLAFPECSRAAVEFYRKLAQMAGGETDVQFTGDTTAAHLTDCSERFRRFIDLQLQTFTQCASAQCSLNLAAQALTAPHRGLWAIRGGAQALADALADALGESLKKSGGKLRLDSTVLRLAYDSVGAPIGVDLLSGERVTATRAIVSNLTLWDTYGKLIGLGRTPPTVSAQLKQLSAWGTYLLFLGMDQNAALRLKSNRLLALTEWQSGQIYEPDQAQFVFVAAPDWDSRAPEGKRAVTVSMFTRAEDWFAFHQDETAHEEQDQATLESLWSGLHSTMPELGDSVEVIETATPRTFYDNTRRKLGMVGRPFSSPEFSGVERQFGTTIFPNVFLVGDTVCSGLGISGVCHSASILADVLSGRTS